jgi:hypothetical protein
MLGASQRQPARKDVAMDVDLVRFLHSRRTHDLITCSLCMRVLRGSEWIEAERVIREIRSYELDELPRLHSRVCDVCAESIFSRRTSLEQPVAA